VGENRQVEAPLSLAAPPGLERQRFDQHSSTPPDLNIAWISPRRSGHVADCFDASSVKHPFVAYISDPQRTIDSNTRKCRFGFVRHTCKFAIPS
jgi:hypothetical protein